LSLHEYAAVVKNLRGVIYSRLKPSEFEERLTWLGKRFRYRNLGLTPTVLSTYGEVVQKFLGKPLLELKPPVKGLTELVETYSELLELPVPVVEAYCYASMYVSPMIVLDGRCLRDLEPITVDRVLVKGPLTDRDYKLHMRIADYTVLDFYRWATSGALEALRKVSGGLDVSDLVEERVKKVKDDKKRFWRIMSGKGSPFLLYLDLLPKLAERVTPDRASELLERYGEVAPATLAIVSAVVV